MSNFLYIIDTADILEYILMAHSEQSPEVCTSLTRNSGLSALSRTSESQPEVSAGNSTQHGLQKTRVERKAAEDPALSKDHRTVDTALAVEKGGLLEDDVLPPGDKPSIVSTESLSDCKAPVGGSSAISSSVAALEAARAASMASSRILDYTPLSSLPSSGSLMRHLFELRRRQQEQRRKLDASIQSASPTLAVGGLQHVPNETAAVPRPPIQRFGGVAGSVFTTSTPQSATLGSISSSKFSSDKCSIPTSLPIETLSRRPLSHLPLDRVPFDLNTKSPIDNISLVEAKTHEVLFDENSPPEKFQEKRKIDSNTLSSPYNPDLYRSPPKKEKLLKAERTRSVTGSAAPPKTVHTFNHSSLNTSIRINDTSVGNDDRPLSSSNKSFEDLILEKIKAGVYRSSPTDTPAPKNSFLRKGTGKARFEQINDFSVMKENIASSSPQEIFREQDSGVQPTVKFPYLKKGEGTRRFNCKSVKLKKATSHPPAQGTKEKVACVNKLTLEEPLIDNFSTPIRASGLHIKMNAIPTKNDWGGGQFSPISLYPRKEREELAAFERLEELADNTSLSSHASTVNSLLLKGLSASTSSTPTDSPHVVRNRVLDGLSPSRSRHWVNPLQSVGYQATTWTRMSQPDRVVDSQTLESLAHQVAGVPFKERVPIPSTRVTSSGDLKKTRTVQFCERGAQILEYCVSECDTTSEAPTASDASEYLNVSDLEALNQLSREGKLPGSCISAQFVANRINPDFVPSDVDNRDHISPLSRAVTSTDVNVRDDDSVDTVVGTPPYDRFMQPTSASGNIEFGRREVCARDQKRLGAQNHQGVHEKQAPRRDQPPARHTVLQFSPPRMPPNAASHAIWEAFGSKQQLESGKPSKANVNAKQQSPPKAVKVYGADQRYRAEHALEFTTEGQSKQAELEAHKVLLVSKVHELEREITSFQTENAQLAKLKDTLQREKEQLSKERKMFEVAVKEDRSRMEDHFEREKRKLWAEKCAMESSKETVQQKNNTLEIINLKEEILVLKRELDRKDSMHNFTQSKLKERIKELDQQKKDLEKKTEKVISLEKENMSLKHQIDRLKLANKLKPTKTIQSFPKDYEQPNKKLFNKSVRFACAHQSNNVPILEIKSKNRNSSFFANNFGGSLPDIASKSSNKPEPSIDSPYDSYLSRIPFSAVSSMANAANAEQDTATSAGNDSSLNCSESVIEDGSRVTTFANGNKKQVFPSGRVVLEYCNGDWEETLPGRATVYYYSETGTRQTTHHDSGLEEVEFSDGVTEKRLPDGSVDVSFPDGSRTLRRSDGTEEVQLTDGTLVVVAAGGAEKVLHLPNGQREVHGRGFKRREYPDCTVKVLYDDGSTKTTYPGGRVRVKDKDGNLVSDSKHGMDLTASSGHQSC